MTRIVRLLVLLFVSAVAVAASPTDQSASESAGSSSLQEILSNISEDKLHHALHVMSDKFRHGVFPTDSNAIEALHKEDASLVARLMKIAKRQSDGNNNSSSPAPATSETASPTRIPTSDTPTQIPTDTTPTESTPSEVPTETTSHEPGTDSETRSWPPSETAPSTRHSTPASTPASTPPPSTSSEHTEQSTTSKPSPASTSTNTQPPSTLSTSSTKASDTTTPDTTHTDDEPYTSTYRSTTTLPNGSLSTVTAVTVVTPTPTGSETTEEPGLQTGGAAPAGLAREFAAMVGGAAMVAMVL